jgi:hypothetical protein
LFSCPPPCQPGCDRRLFAHAMASDFTQDLEIVFCYVTVRPDRASRADKWASSVRGDRRHRRASRQRVRRVRSRKRDPAHRRGRTLQLRNLWTGPSTKLCCPFICQIVSRVAENVVLQKNKVYLGTYMCAYVCWANINHRRQASPRRVPRNSGPPLILLGLFTRKVMFV